MKRHPRFSLERLWAIIVKEFTQMRRDRLTFAMMLGIPLLQLTLFGYASIPTRGICPRPCSSPTTARKAARCFTRCKTAPTSTSQQQVQSEAEGRELLAQGQVQFVVNIPENFTRDLLRGDHPSILVEA
jgi:ABC-2 type transport system permease protein